MDVAAPTLDALFAEAGRACLQAITEPATIAAESRRAVDLASPELDLLLVDWLGEILFRFETEGYLPATLEVSVARDVGAQPAAAAAREGGWRLHAELMGQESAADQVPIKVLIKAVTYHQLTVRETAGGWSARIIFDI